MKWNRVMLRDMWGSGADHSLSTPRGELPEFWLRPRYLQGPDGTPHLVNYAIDFAPGYLADGWIGATFTPVGKDSLDGISLPAWDPNQRDKYRKAINDADGKLDHPRTARLEAIIPYVDDNGNPGYNYVRIFRASGACPAPKEDWLVIKTKTFGLSKGAVQALQDGWAHGPPD